MRPFLFLAFTVAAVTTTLAPAETITDFTYSISVANPFSPTPLTTSIAFSINSDQQPTVTSVPGLSFGPIEIPATPVYTYSGVAASVNGQAAIPLTIAIAQSGTRAPDLAITDPATGLAYNNPVVIHQTDNPHATDPGAGFFFSVSDTGAVSFNPGDYDCNLSYMLALGKELRPVSPPTLSISQYSITDPPLPPTPVTPDPTPTAVTPEPASLALLGTGLAGLGTVLRRRTRA